MAKMKWGVCLIGMGLTGMLAGAAPIFLTVLLFILSVAFGVAAILLPDEYISIPRVRREKGADPSMRSVGRPEHVSWREIDEPLLYGWEYRFRQSLGPIPDDIEALKGLSIEAEVQAGAYAHHINSYHMRYRSMRELRGDDDYRRLDEAHKSKLAESSHFINLYNQEVRKFYLLAPEDPIGLPMKYELPDDGATRLSVNHRLPRKGSSNRVHIV